MSHGRESSDCPAITFADDNKIIQSVFHRKKMFRRIAVIKKANSLELAQVFCSALKRQLKTPCKKTDAHVYIRNFVLVGHISNIDYTAPKNKLSFIF